jgi:hypothetical protein
MTEYVHVGSHADVLSSGRPVGPGQRLTDKDLDLPGKDNPGEDQHLLDEGRIVSLDSFGGSLSVEEAKAKASELNIEGRSKMSADELRAAVAQAAEGENLAS